MFFNEDTNGNLNFDVVSESYHFARPGYPSEVYKKLITVNNNLKDSVPNTLISNILEIGSGSGQATKELVKISAHLDCVEPGINFVNLLRSQYHEDDGVEIHHVTFEEFTSNKKYDIVFSACALHWIPKDIAYKKTQSLLKKGGYLVAVWNMCRFQDDIYSLMDKIIKPYDKELDIPRGEKESFDWFEVGFKDFSCNRDFVNCTQHLYENQRKIDSSTLVNLVWSYVNLTAIGKHNEKKVFEKFLEGVQGLNKEFHTVHNFFHLAAGQKQP